MSCEGDGAGCRAGDRAGDRVGDRVGGTLVAFSEKSPHQTFLAMSLSTKFASLSTKFAQV